ncbi:two-component system response regulator RR class II (RRII)-OmpR [Synechococcus sp. BIOS-E4-1]|uniref:winged helix-turn-helix domain-containing protein n=1 Tax=Synechococcus sp. BIOS-E4-1 TaxID=1400864 RepID=UPI0016495F47|nr:response regulator transcription factor [Synechococcus sp. BIOS-E4-1]QNI53501.1 two-component system response regulator RR class II (RRII)-OmpR [Synechococcus sp. BIOS-E4-1]
MTVEQGSSAASLQDAVVLLVGHEAAALAERLRASGYVPIDWTDGAERGPVSGSNPTPVAAVLASDQESRVLELRSRFGSLPILIGVSDDSIAARESVLACGADDFWFTFSAPSDLLQRLRLHLSIHSRSALRPPLLQLADLSVDISCRQVHRGSRSVVLTAREYALLLLLLEERGRVVSRDRILRDVWKEDQGSSSNVIEVYVRYLRQKLEEGGEPRLIHTIRGRGYCLNDGFPSLRHI